MEYITKIEMKISTDRNKKSQMMKKVVSLVEKLLNQPQFRDLDLVSVKEVK